MKHRMCLTPHNPPKSYGDCIRACIATLTDDDEVPHVFSDMIEGEESWKQLRVYLKTKGKFLFLIGNEDAFDENNPDIAYMLIHSTLTGNHAVICKNGKVVHNPAWSKPQMTGPPEGCDEYVIGVIGDLV